MATSQSSWAGAGEGGERRLPAEDSSSRPDPSLNSSPSLLFLGAPPGAEPW